MDADHEAAKQSRATLSPGVPRAPSAFADAGIVIAYQRGSHTVLTDCVVVLESDCVARGADGPIDIDSL